MRASKIPRDGYVVAQVVVMPFTAFLGRLFGQKNVYMFCLALFLAGSILCGVAHSLNALILFRAIQGLGAGARFSMLPPDNASGNFVKVVQRVPVRIRWEHPPANLPLRAGLSADVTVHTGS